MGFRENAAVAVAMGGLLLSTGASAQQWKVLQEEGVSVEYRNAADTASLLSIDCSAQASGVVVPVAPGIKPPSQPVLLKIQEPKGERTIALTPDVCGGQSTCTDRPDGDVSSYDARAKNKQLALRIADKASAVKIDAPGAAISAPADKKAFAQFAKLCRKQK